MKDLHSEPGKTTAKLLVSHNFMHGDQESHVEGKSIGIQDDHNNKYYINNKPLLNNLYS
jgi:hypothetical protein